MNKSNVLSNVYYGEEVERYDERRKDKKWEGEEKAFSLLISHTKPREIIDCPIGTGRWLSFYKNNLLLEDAVVTGLDISLDMQQESERKAKRIGLPLKVDTLNIFSDDMIRFEGNKGLFVSTRFLNWVHPSDLPGVIEAYANANPQWIICSLRYKSGFSISEIGRRMWSKYIRRRRVIFIHDIQNFVQLIEKHGYCVGHEEKVEHSAATKLSYFLLKKE